MNVLSFSKNLAAKLCKTLIMTPEQIRRLAPFSIRTVDGPKLPFSSTPAHPAEANARAPLLLWSSTGSLSLVASRLQPTPNPTSLSSR